MNAADDFVLDVLAARLTSHQARALAAAFTEVAEVLESAQD